MTYQSIGRVIGSVGGRFTVSLGRNAAQPMPLDGKTVVAQARGALRRRGELLVGDLVEVGYEDSSFSRADGEVIPSPDGTAIVVESICERKNALIRPPMANLDILFVTLAAASPEPVMETVDKLISIAEFHRIEPVLVITKRELAPEVAEKWKGVYAQAGFTVFAVGRDCEDDGNALSAYIEENLKGRIAAFSGASGVGKSTLLNRLFPSLSLETGEISRRIERGKNTTRRVELYPLSEDGDCGYLADTPGFTMLDFERFDFFDKEDLPETFREFRPHIGECRFTKCSHTKEQGCAILEAMRRGEIAPSRHQSFLSLYEVLKKKTKW